MIKTLNPKFSIPSCGDRTCGSHDCKSCYPASYRDPSPAQIEEKVEEVCAEAESLLDKRPVEFQMEFLESYWEHYLEDHEMSVERLTELWGEEMQNHVTTHYQFFKEMWIENARDDAKGISFSTEESEQSWGMTYDMERLSS